MKTPAQRIRLCIAGLVMLVAFLAIIAVGVVLVLVFLVGYGITGSEWLYKHIVAFGQGLDQAANVILLDGNPKETISSHTGRFYEAKYGNLLKGRPMPTQPDLVIPWQAVAVRHFTELGEDDHVYNAVEQWAVDQKVPL